MTKERPILFSAPMVRAILDGRKTQTRRIVKRNFGPDPTRFSIVDKKEGLWAPETNSGKMFLFPSWQPFKCPYGIPGDRLWARETWGWNGCLHCPIHYRATEPNWREESPNPGARWYPSIHMDRGASRINLEIVMVRVERLQDISEEDAIAEGVAGRDEYARLWDVINGKGAWEKNPWVWVLEFKQIGVV